MTDELSTLLDLYERLDHEASLDRALYEIKQEARRQVSLWGVQHHPLGTGLPGGKEAADFARAVCDAHAKAGTVTWLDILNEEVREAFAEEDHADARVELIQVAAVALSIVADIDSKEGN